MIMYRSVAMAHTQAPVGDAGTVAIGAAKSPFGRDTLCGEASNPVVRHLDPGTGLDRTRDQSLCEERPHARPYRPNHMVVGGEGESGRPNS